MNHIYRVVWNSAVGAWQAVAECARGRGKSKSAKPLLVVATLALAGAGQSWAAGTLPTGGSIVAGNGSISQSGSAMTINQASNRLAIDWQGFSVGKGNTVNFVQPGASAVALNRVLGSDVSVIQGAITANGQIFLINPNGVLFSPTSQVNVGSLVASTLNMRTADFMAGRYTFEGAGSNAVVNQGNITAVGEGGKGGSIALIAARVSNEGSLNANAGNVLLAAGGGVTLDLGGPVKLQVSQGALDAQVDNGGAIKADGGLVYLTARAVNELTRATVNNTGTIRAQTLASGETGEIRLIADMQHGVLNAGGSLDASAPKGGDGGLIETSGARVNTLPDLRVNAGAATGKGGEWLIDPYDYTIGASQASTIVDALNNGSSVTVSTETPSGIAGYTAPAGSGDITVSSAIAKTAGGNASLTLRADRNILVNQNITSSSGALNLTLSAANSATGTLGGIKLADGVTLNSNGGTVLLGGAGGSVAGAKTSVHGIAYALNASSILPAISIGAGSKILSRGGDITINGYSTQPVSGSNDTSGILFAAGALVDSGYYAPGASYASSGGYINITGKYVGGVGGNTNKVFGVFVDYPSGGAGQTTFSASTTSGGIRIDGSSTYDAGGAYALSMATGGLAGNIYFNAYSVADLIFVLNGGLKGVTFTYSPPNSGCRTGYPNCGTLMVNAGANSSYLYGTYNAVNMATLPIYVSATITGSKTYDSTNTASNLTFSGITILDPGASGYTSSNVTSATYITPSANVGSYLNLSANSLSRNYTAGGKNYVVGYNFSVSPAYQISPAVASLAAVKTYDGDATFTSDRITVSGVNGETLSLAGAGTATANSLNVESNGANYLTSLGGLTLANGVSGTQGLASNYVLPSFTARSVNNVVTINPFGLTVLGVGGSRAYDGTTLFSAGNLSLGAGVVDGDQVLLSGSANVASKNVGTYTEWASSSLTLGGSGASNYTLTGGAVLAQITPAPLGVALNAVYNGTTRFTSTGGATNAAAGSLTTGGSLQVAGLMGSERLTEVTVSDANADVVTAGKSVTAAAGSNGFVASNYALRVGANSSVAGGAITSANNTVAITPAPLGVAAAPTYNGSTDFTATAGVAHGTTGSLTTGGSVSVAGLVNGQTLGGFSLDSANVVGASKVTGVSLTGGIDARNYVLNGSAFGSAAAVTAGANPDGTAATNVAAIAAAPLGVALDAVYNGTTRFTSTGGATNAAAGTVSSGGSLQVAGLMGSERLTEVTVSDANADVVTAGKSVTAAAGSNGFVASNYALRVGANSSVAGGAITSANNTVAITPAPLGVAVTGTYDGSTTYSLGQGDTRIAAFGLVGRDASVQLTTATLASRNAGTNRVVSIAGPAGFNPANYVLNGSLNITPETAGTAADGSGATNAAVIAQRRITVLADDKSKTFGRPDPEFTYRVSEGSLVAGDSLSGELSRTPGEALGTRPISAAGLTNGNYAITALDGQLTIVAPVQPPPPPTPIIVPAFIDNGSSVLGSAVQPPSFGGLNYVREGGSQGGAPIAPQGARPNAGAEQTPGGRSSLNFVSGAPADADGPDNRAGAAAPGAAGGEQTGTGRSTLNFVSSSSTENAPATGGEGGKRKAAQELNVNNVTVPSSSGPLDVFVIDSGINASGVGTLNSLNTQ